MLKKLAAVAVVLALTACAATPAHTPPDYERAARQPLPLTPIGDVKLYGDGKAPKAIAPQPVPGTFLMCRNTGRTIVVPTDWTPAHGDPCGAGRRSLDEIRTRP